MTPQVTKSTGPEFDEGLTALRALPGFDGHRFNPVALVRTVNHLHRTGFALALDLLRAYCAEAEQSPTIANPDNVLLVARLLFVPKEQATPPELALGRPDLVLPADPAAFPWFPLHLVRDLPLLLVGGYIVGGESLPPLPYIEWFAQQGLLRASALHPAANPVLLVDDFLRSPLWLRLTADESHAAMLRQQGIRALLGLETLPPEVTWDTLRTRDVDWDTQSETFA